MGRSLDDLEYFILIYVKFPADWGSAEHGPRRLMLLLVLLPALIGIWKVGRAVCIDIALISNHKISSSKGRPFVLMVVYRFFVRLQAHSFSEV